MPFDWNQYLILAKSLSGDDDAMCNDESYDRSAVSRAYYAAFCLARNYARDHYSYHPRYTAEDHIEVRKYYASLVNQLTGILRGKILMIPSQLENLRLWRNNCDYKDEHPNLATTVRMALEQTELLIETLALDREVRTNNSTTV